jgi:nifR3 family TIM-barrel protein
MPAFSPPSVTSRSTTDVMRDFLRASPVRLAPMASFTNVPFRQVAMRCGSGITTNEEIDADALVRDNAWAVEASRADLDGGPVVMQLLGNRAETLVPAALRLVEAGADVIDINMGCPVPKVVTKGKGAALMRDLTGTAALLVALRRALDGVPLTIKIRGGWDDEHANAVEFARMAEDTGVDAITVHPRTRAQRYGGRAPWDVIADVVRAVQIPVTGNGDVTSLDEAHAMIEATGCVSVMVGRAALGRPWLFDPSYVSLSDEARARYEADVIAEHMARIQERFAPSLALVQMKKHLAHYGAARPDARALRADLFAQPDAASLLATYRAQSESALLLA